jgi:hypothetical protein
MAIDPTSTDLRAQMRTIRAAVKCGGEAHVTGAELTLLSEGGMTRTKQLLEIAKIAQWEGWSFDFFRDGSIRFAQRFI